MCVDDPLNWSVFKTVLYADDTYLSFVSEKFTHPARRGKFRTS